MNLGKMIPVDLREIWKHEAHDFTQWMAKPENIESLNNTIGLSLVDIQTEKDVGAYKCDIVCRDEFSNNIVIIENQLESTDHDHLGKIITYASGLDASVIIWIVKEAREEHTSAIEWLNNHTDDTVSFFLLEVKAWKIGSSDPAIQLNIIEAPNDFNKNMKKTISVNSPTETEMKKQEFWTAFNEVMKERKEFNIRKAWTSNWYDFSIGKSSCHLSAELINPKNKIRLSFLIPDDKELFDRLFENKEEIEKKVGTKLDWDRLEGKKASRIATYISNFSFSHPETYPELSNKMIDILVSFRTTFQEYL